MKEKALYRGISHNLQRYLKEISERDPLSPKEEIELACKVKQGDK
ncbi:MAG: RNA polymerase subunit sigma, partial [Candidatus Marinimicrobia bacterium]|nr:RNA polymerase subunit sigma [Candidatus Neomarinimicrobiota bacterium]